MKNNPKIKRVILNNSKSSITLKINPEQSYYRIAEALIEIDKANIGSSIEAEIKFILSRNSDQTTTTLRSLYLNDFEIKDNIYFLRENLKVIEDLEKFENLEIAIVCNTNFQFKFVLTNVNLHIDVKPLFTPFKTHIDLSNNSKILFSAPFGHGKTTFLDGYFYNFQEEYEVFKIYPVNYSVATNEDIFQYIKCELLFQLLGSDVEFEKLDFSFMEKLPEFLKAEPIKIFGALVRLIPGVGKNWFEIFSELTKLTEAYTEFGKKTIIDDKQITEDYLKAFYEKEGSIYEDNIYTQIIRQLLEQLKHNSGKKNVLIIDDLDRMDPEHIFRILNVFSAHFDNENYHFEGITNKFGFDKIIIVCDRNNILNIYNHKFGSDCDFKGYISKYFSIEPYIFDNKSFVIQYIESLRFKVKEGSPYPIIKHILIDFARYEELSIRDLRNFQTLDLSLLFEGSASQTYSPYLVDEGTHHFIYFIIIHYLLKLYDLNSFKRKLNILKTRGVYQSENSREIYKTAIRTHGFIALLNNKQRLSYDKVNYTLNNKEFELIPYFNENSPFQCFYIRNISITNGSIEEYSIGEFYEILEMNLEKYLKLDGLKGGVKR